MGGFGSGGWNRTYAGTTEDHLRLDIVWLKRNGYLKQNGRNRLTWQRNGLVQLDLLVECDGEQVQVCDATATGSRFPDALSQSLPLIWSPRHVGGGRRLFECPVCQSHRQHLYLKGSRFVCRQCAQLTYRVRRERKIARTFRRWGKYSAALGGVCWEGWGGIRRPKGMHMNTYQSHVFELHRLEGIVTPSLIAPSADRTKSV